MQTSSKFAPLCNDDLTKLAILFDTDKWNTHWYARHYQKHFSPLRLQKLKVLEIGVGGYDDPHIGGNSLRMWKAFFPYSMIYGIDIYDKKSLEEERIKIFRGSQEDESFLRRVTDEIGGLDIVIDDGSHVNKHVIKTFEVLFPLLNQNGIYVIEDTQTSYWPHFGGSSVDLNQPATIMGYFKRLVDCLNHDEYLVKNYQASYFDKHIVSMDFYHNMIFVLKGDNNEGSNLVNL